MVFNYFNSKPDDLIINKVPELIKVALITSCCKNFKKFIIRSEKLIVLGDI